MYGHAIGILIANGIMFYRIGAADCIVLQFAFSKIGKLGNAEQVFYCHELHELPRMELLRNLGMVATDNTDHTDRARSLKFRYLIRVIRAIRGPIKKATPFKG